MIGRYDSRIGRHRTAMHIRGTPIASVMFGSFITAVLPVIAQSPLLPPLGLMLLLAWRVLRPDFWPLWIGLPLGLFEDLMSGQPLGSSVLIWSVILLVLDFEGQRHFWRDYWHGWFTASLALTFGLSAGWFVSHLSGSGGSITLILPQLAYSIGLFPLIVRICAGLDRWRLP